MAKMTDKDNELLMKEPKGTQPKQTYTADKNIPVEARDRSFKPNQYYWIKTKRTPRWFPAKRVASCWYIVGTDAALTEEITHIGSMLVCPHA